VEVQIDAAKLDHPRTRTGKVAVLPIRGPIAQHDDILLRMFGGTSTEKFGQVFDQVLANRDVDHVVLDIESPGGSVYGVQELADKIHAGRQRKNIFAAANSYAFSAAYWLGSQASEFAVTPSGEVGSIGVIAVHEDWSEALAAAGVKPTLITAGRHKGEGHPFAPLSDEDREAIQESVNDYYDDFTKAVARGRGVTQSAVKSGFGEGRAVGARAALAEGMVDRISSLEGVLASLGVRQTSATRAAERARLAEIDA